MNPRETKVAERLKELIKEGEGLRAKEISKRDERGGSHIFIPDVGGLKEWMVKGSNILKTAFGDSVHYPHLIALGNPANSKDVDKCTAVLRAALSDLEGGFLAHQEFIVAADVFDSVLDQAKDLLGKGYKDPAAMLGRAVLEDSLRRLANRNSIQDAVSTKASVLNDKLRDKQVYNQVQWRSIQVISMLVTQRRMENLGNIKRRMSNECLKTLLDL